MTTTTSPALATALTGLDDLVERWASEAISASLEEHRTRRTADAALASRFDTGTLPPVGWKVNIETGHAIAAVSGSVALPGGGRVRVGLAVGQGPLCAVDGDLIYDAAQHDLLGRPVLVHLARWKTWFDPLERCWKGSVVTSSASVSYPAQGVPTLHQP